MNNDLISREELKEEFKGRCICNCDRCKYYTRAYCGLIDNAPTVEQPTGEWIIDGHHIRCNKCNEYICIQDMEGMFIPDNFCPNCGAKMKGGETNE